MRTLICVFPVVALTEDVDVSSLLQLKADGRDVQNADMDCKQGPERCKKKPPTCDGYVCPTGSDPISTAVTCGTSCSDDQCCVTTTTTTTTQPTCSDFEDKCPFGIVDNMKMSECGNKFQCLKTCCKRPTCSDVKDKLECPSESEYDPNMNMKECKGAECKQICCKTTTTTTTPEPTCADFEHVCPRGKLFDDGKKMDKCGNKMKCLGYCCRKPICSDFETKNKCPRGSEYNSASSMKEFTSWAGTCCKRLTTTTTTTPALTCSDFKMSCPRGMMYKGQDSMVCGDRMKCWSKCCAMPTTTAAPTTTTTTTTTDTPGERREPPPSAPVVECRLFGDPEIHSFDGVTDKDRLFQQRRVSTSQMDFYKEGQFWLVNGPNIKIQGEFHKIGRLSKSSMTKVAVSGRACEGKVLQLLRGDRRDQSQTLQLDGRPITKWGGSARSGYSYKDGTFIITKTQDQRTGGWEYLIKFEKDSTVEIFYEPKFFSNVPDGMQDVDIMMKKRTGVIGLCGDMSGDKLKGIGYMMNLKSKVKDGESLFGGTIPVREVPQQQCPAQTKKLGEQFCMREVCGNNQRLCGTRGAREKNFKDCCFDYCNGGEAVARGNFDFQQKADQVRAVETGRSTGTTASWLHRLSAGRTGGFTFGRRR